MPAHLKRFQREGDDHFITFSCDERRQNLRTAQARDMFLESLEKMREEYDFEVLGYVVMPEHVHLLVSEPSDPEVLLWQAIKAVKLSVARNLKVKGFWEERYHDFNVFTHNKRVEKLRYMHRNPVTRGLVEKPEDWKWSSCRHYLLNEESPVKVTRFGEGGSR